MNLPILTVRLHYGCSANMVKRVVGGENTDIKSVPYAVSKIILNIIQYKIQYLTLVFHREIKIVLDIK